MFVICILLPKLLQRCYIQYPTLVSYSPYCCFCDCGSFSLFKMTWPQILLKVGPKWRHIANIWQWCALSTQRKCKDHTTFITVVYITHHGDIFDVIRIFEISWNNRTPQFENRFVEPWQTHIMIDALYAEFALLWPPQTTVCVHSDDNLWFHRESRQNMLSNVKSLRFQV